MTRLGRVSLGRNLAVNAISKSWIPPAGRGYSQPEPFWWFRYDYYSWTGWSHDGGYGCQIPQRIDLVPGYRWRGHAAVDNLVSHSGRNSMRMVALPGDNFGILARRSTSMAPSRSNSRPGSRQTAFTRLN